MAVTTDGITAISTPNVPGSMSNSVASFGKRLRTAPTTK